MTKEYASPWPGPRPYEARDHHLFFGRFADLKKLIETIARQRLTILSAPSGVGKSSLLQAGLVPALRQWRQSENESGFGPTLILRGWGRHGGAGSPPACQALAVVANVLRDCAEARDQDAQNRLNHDMRAEEAELLLQVEAPQMDTGRKDLFESRDMVARFVEYIGRLSEKLGPRAQLRLVVDQAEELLGSSNERNGDEVRAEALEILRRLYDSRCVRLLVCLRNEFENALRPLERSIGPIGKRIIDLRAVSGEQAVSILRESNKIEMDLAVTIDEDAIERTVALAQDRGVRDVEMAGDTPVSLLGLQALLIQFVDMAKKEGDLPLAVSPGSDSRRLTISLQLIDRWQQGLARGISPVEHALKSYIDLHVAGEDSLSSESQTPDLVRRMIVRMAPCLSTTLGYKRAVERSEMMMDALEEDVDALFEGVGLKGPGRAELARLLVGPGDGVRFGIGDLLEEKAGRRDVGSGRAKAEAWTADHVGEALCRAADRAVYALERAGIVKQGSAGKEQTFELAHDGFGVPFRAWANEQRQGIKDTLAAIIMRRGENFRWGKIPNEEIRHVRWRGCTLSRATIENVTFADCDFAGFVFRDCDFENVTFRRCRLDGALFVRDPGFSPGSKIKHVEFIHCDIKSALFSNLSCSGLNFEKCILDGTTMDGVILERALVLRGCRAHFVQLGRFMHDAVDGRWIDISDCSFSNSVIDDLVDITKDAGISGSTADAESDDFSDAEGRLP